jgi:hypothetical protein
MLDLVVKDGVGLRHRHPRPRHRRGHLATRPTPCCCAPAATATSSTCRPTPWLQRHRGLAGPPQGRAVRQPCFTQIHPTCIPASDEFQSKLTLMSESLRNDGRIWVPRRTPTRPARRPDPRGGARLLPRAQVPELRQPRAPRRRLPQRQDRGRRGQGRRPAQERRVPRLRRRHRPPRRGHHPRSATGTCSTCTSASPTRTPTSQPMRIYPAVHYTMGGLWVDYDLMTNVPGLFVLGEANFSDHGANRLGASALMQGLADGYFVIPYTIGNYLAACSASPSRCPPTTRSPGRGRRDRDQVKRSCRSAAPARRPLPPRARQDHVGLLRHGPQRPASRRRCRDPRPARGVREGRAGARHRRRPQPVLEKAGRVADFFELAELMCRDALDREESCGGHFREEHQTEEGEAKRDDENFAYVGGLGVDRRGRPPRAPQGAARVRERPADPAQLQVEELRPLMNLTLKVWRQDGPDAPAASRPTRPTASATTCRSSRCSTCVNERSSPRARSRSPSTTTAARASAAPAG